VPITSPPEESSPERELGRTVDAPPPPLPPPPPLRLLALPLLPCLGGGESSKSPATPPLGEAFRFSILTGEGQQEVSPRSAVGATRGS